MYNIMAQHFKCNLFLHFFTTDVKKYLVQTLDQVYYCLFFKSLWDSLAGSSAEHNTHLVVDSLGLVH